MLIESKVKVKSSLSRVRLFAIQWTVVYQAPLSIFQAWILEWVAISFSMGSSWPRDWTQVSRIVGRGFTLWATRDILSVDENLVILKKQRSSLEGIKQEELQHLP